MESNLQRRPSSPGGYGDGAYESEGFSTMGGPGGGQINSPTGGYRIGEEINGFEIVGSEMNEYVSQKSKSTPSTALSGQRRTKTSRITAVQQEKPKFTKEEYARAFFKCECIVCKTQVTHEMMLLEKKKFNAAIYYEEEVQFRDLIEKMFPNSDKIKGAQILFPDTVFFEDGKPLFIARIDKDGCLTKISQASKLSLQEVRQKFSQIVRDRRKETQLLIFPTNPGAQYLQGKGVTENDTSTM